MKKKNTSKNIYDEYLTIDNLYKMWDIIRVTCKNKRDIYYFSLNLNTNLTNIYNSLKNKTYTPSKYRAFMIFEPKPRLVMSQSIADKIVNHFVANYYLIPYLENSLIDTNVATRKEKGSGYAMKLIKKYLNKLIINYPNQEIYCLKIDISKYFYSIDHEILLQKLQKHIHDQDVINLIKLIINETNSSYINDAIKKYNKIYNLDIPYYVHNTGLSIGAMSSQFLAIFYLSSLDHYIKENLKCSYYVRYMDDFLILDTDKENLKRCYTNIVKYVEELKLKVNKKSNIYRCSKGFSFLGYTYQVYNNKLHITCKKETCLRINKRLNYLKKNDNLSYRKSLGSYYGYFDACKSIERENIKLSIKEVYNLYKLEKKDYIVIVKTKNMYMTYEQDAIMMWYLFNYLYTNGTIKFSNTSFDRVINKLKNLNINFIIVTKNDLLLSYSNEVNKYLEYLHNAKAKFLLTNREKKIINQFKILISKNPKVIDKIEIFLENINKNIDVQ